MSTRRSRKWIFRTVSFALALSVTTLVIEGFLVALRHVPAISSPPALREIARELYMLDRNMIQFEAAAAIWNPDLGYTLRPGRFRFRNTEFETSYDVNRLGVRDDSQSLEGPQIVVIGDSFAQGWGVEQGETFASVLEHLSGLRVLNTAIASYGTARQLRLLRSVDLSQATHLIIQFCNNDYFENVAFEREGPDFATQTETGYRNAVVSYEREKRYLPGRYTLAVFGARLGHGDRGSAPESTPDPGDPAALKRQVELFVHVMLASQADLTNLKIIVFELNAYNRYPGLFTTALADFVDHHDELPASLRTMQIVDLASELAPDQWFRLDDHVNAAGHRFLAQRLWKIMNESPNPRPISRDPAAAQPEGGHELPRGR